MSAAWNPSRWLNVPRGSFKPAPGVLVAPHLQLVRPVTGAHELDVWVADQLTLQIEVAVKFAPQEADGSGAPVPGAREAPAGGDVHRFLRQARCAAKIGDPHLVQVLEQGKAKGGIPFIVMELLEGMSLSQRLLSGPLALAEAQAVLNQVAGVLAKAHPFGLWHGSLCPEHLFSSEAAGELFVKIANFADVSSDTWATDPASKLAPDAPSRKQAYLSPEQLRQAAGSSAAADLWALGVTLYELLTTTLPFEAPTAAAVSVAICNAQFAPPSHYRADLPPAVDAWFARVFAPQQSARWFDPLDLAREFGRAIGGSVHQDTAAFVGGPRVGETLAAQHGNDGDGFEDGDERTIRWDVPSEWEPPHSHSRAPQLSRLPDAERLSARPSSGPPPLPDRPPSSHPPAPFPGGYAPTLAFPAPRAASFPPVPPAVLPAAVLPAAVLPAAVLGRSLSDRALAAAAAAPGVAGLGTHRTATAVAVAAPSAAIGFATAPYQVTKARGLPAGTLLAGTLLAGIGGLLVWGLQSWPSGGDSAGVAGAQTRTAPLVSTAATEGGPHSTGSATSRAPSHPSAPPIARVEDLPVILQTDELPRAPDDMADNEEDGSDGAESSAAASVGSPGTQVAGTRHAPTAATTKSRSVASVSSKPAAATAAVTAAAIGNSADVSAKSDPGRGSKGDAKLDPGAVAAHPANKPSVPAATPRRDTSHRSPKHVSANADCNPPYFFDNNNIRRLKLECL